MITKALVEFPPKFAGLPPVNPEAQAKLQAGGVWHARGAQGLAEDVRYYGRWMRDEAERRIGHLYPQVELPDGSKATVIAWLWARTVASPNPAAKGAHVPLVSSFVLSMKAGRQAWVEPVLTPDAPDGYRFEVHVGKLRTEEAARLKEGTVDRRGGRCILTGTPIPLSHIRTEGKTGRTGARLMSIVAASNRDRVYLPPSAEHELIAAMARPEWAPETDLPKKALGFRVQGYGITKHADLFTRRQVAALTTISDLVLEARAKVLEDGKVAGLSDNPIPLAHGGTGTWAYADLIALYLAFGDYPVDVRTAL